MASLLTNAPPQKVWVRKEYLRDLRDGHGEFVLGYWVSIKSLPGRCFYFETFIPEYGALFDKLPISAFVAWDSDNPHTPTTPGGCVPAPFRTHPCGLAQVWPMATSAFA